MGTKNLLGAVDALILTFPKPSSGDDCNITKAVENVITEWYKLDIFFRRLNVLLKIIAEGGVITDACDLILVAAWDECEPDVDKFIRRMYSLPEIQEITDPAELPEYLSDEDLRVTEAAKLKLDELTLSKNARNG